ncbi:MAG: VIT1/CCC1 transporter family protein [Anaerolineaceae bacterium]|nr:VIT1/CCC1 transporter family protein [Anaerolineaceae bacterium]
MDQRHLTTLLQFQNMEATGGKIYRKLSQMEKDPQNQVLLARIADEEDRHYELFKNLTQKVVKPNFLQVWFYIAIATILGITFALKLMEKGEAQAQEKYQQVLDLYPEINAIIDEEEKHEQELLGMIAEERLEYVGSMVLGLNDALVELTGTLAGLTFAFRDTQLIALSGLITGIAASLSMASSEYLSFRAEGKINQALKASIYTGIAYIVTVILLVMPYLLVESYLLALGLTMVMAVLIILVFNFYISVAKDISFRKHFTEMVSLSLGVAALSFGIGILVRELLGVEI